MDQPFGGFTEEALEAYQQAVAEAKGTDFSEGGSYDFTQCVRPDGTGFGTKGACKPPNRPAAAGAADPKKKKESFIDKQKRMLGDQKKAGFNPLAQAKGRGDRARERNAMVVNAIKSLFGKK